MFGRNKKSILPEPKMSKEHEQLRDEVINTRELLLAEIRKLNRKFDLKRARKSP